MLHFLRFYLLGDIMKLVKTWLIIILVCIGILYLGKHEHSHLITFIGVIGIAAGGTCEVSSLIIQFIKLRNR